MKNIIIKLGAIIIVLLFGVIIFNSCSKSENNDNLYKSTVDNVTIMDNLSDEEYKSRLIDLNINFWTNLSSNSIIEVKKACDEKNIEGLIKLCNFSDEELSSFMNTSINYAKRINPDNNNSSCNCDSDINFDTSIPINLRLFATKSTFFRVLQNISTNFDFSFSKRCFSIEYFNLS